MKGQKSKIYFAIIILSGVFLLDLPSGLAAEGKARVYKKDAELTPESTEVVLEDLDDSGHLQNPYLKLFLKKASRYDYPAYSPAGNFIYEPTRWGYFNISAEGIKFDQVSTYYYLTLARKYFQEHFGFRQSFDGKTIDRLTVQMFFDEPLNDQYFTPPMITCSGEGCQMFVNVPGDPQYKWAPNHYRAFSVLMHEYSHFVFHRFRQRCQYQSYAYFSEEQAVDEGFAIFWPCSIMDEPRYGRALSHPQMVPPYLSLATSLELELKEPGERLKNMIDALSSALWALREHQRIGKSNAEKIIYEAMALVPHENARLTDVTAACIKAKESLPQEIRDNLYEQYILGVFARHNIGLRDGPKTVYLTFTEEENNLPEFMRVGQVREVTLKFKNNSPYEKRPPRLKPFNPAINPNQDKKDLITSYAWGISDFVEPVSLNPIPPQGDVSFVFKIIAPPNPGRYACDWAIEIDGQMGYILTKDITIGFIRDDANKE